MTGRGALALAAAAVAALAACAPQPATSTLDADRRAAVAELARARDVQGICYGWVITGTAPHSSGSNQGVGTDLPSSGCDRWMELVAYVEWTPETSEIEDSAQVNVNASADLDAAVPRTNLLDRLGVTLAEVIDDPDDAVLRGVLVLPLLVAEAGLAPPVPRPTATVTPDAARLPAAGSDFLRDRGALLFGGIGALLAAGGGLWLGLWLRQRETARREREKARRRKRTRAPAQQSAVEDLEADPS